MQRGDFLPILAQKLAPGNYVNGLVSGVETLSCNEGRPPSLFQCRVKLFKEWFESWSQAERDQLLNHIKSMDPGFHSKIQEELQSLTSKSANGPQENAENCVEPAVADVNNVNASPEEAQNDENVASDDIVNGHDEAEQEEAPILS